MGTDLLSSLYLAATTTTLLQWTASLPANRVAPEVQTLYQDAAVAFAHLVCGILP
jgi:hypothetical protein